jgi:L-threonylcarbamoyladenylate synthase
MRKRSLAGAVELGFTMKIGKLRETCLWESFFMVNSWRVQQAAREVRAGAVIAYPTEAVWGLGCDPWNEYAVDRLLAIKNRSVSKGLILVADNIRQFDFLFEDFPQDWIDRMASTWPGPNTWLVPHQNLLPEWVTGVHDTVALRVSDHPQVRDLCSLVGPLISTSANPQGRPPARTRLRIEQYFRGQVDLVLGGSLGGRKNPSVIRDLASGDVIRPD